MQNGWQGRQGLFFSFNLNCSLHSMPFDLSSSSLLIASARLISYIIPSLPWCFVILHLSSCLIPLIFTVSAVRPSPSHFSPPSASRHSLSAPSRSLTGPHPFCGWAPTPIVHRRRVLSVTRRNEALTGPGILSWTDGFCWYMFRADGFP